jgi:hypothetical protein
MGMGWLVGRLNRWVGWDIVVVVGVEVEVAVEVGGRWDRKVVCRVVGIGLVGRRERLGRGEGVGGSCFSGE